MVPSPTQRSGCWDAQLEAIILGLLDTCWTQVLCLKVPASWDNVSKMASCFKKGGYRNKKDLQTDGKAAESVQDSSDKSLSTDNLQPGTWQGKDVTSQGSSLALLLIKPQLNSGWGFVGRNVFLSGVCRRHSHYSGQPLAPTSHVSVITAWASSLN